MSIHAQMCELIRRAHEEGQPVEEYRANGERYLFITAPDKWIRIINATDPGSLYPEIEAADRQHAATYCELTEPLRVPAQRIP